MEINTALSKSKSSGGFTLFEVIVALIIIAAASFGLIKSVTYAKAELNSIKLQERAFQELTNYTNYWKARIAGYPVRPPAQVGGIGDEVTLFDEDEGHIVKAYLFRKTAKISHAHTTAQYYSLKTWIEWTDYSLGKPQEKSMEFFCYQLVFPS